jgi:hypothetical protein
MNPGLLPGHENADVGGCEEDGLPGQHHLAGATRGGSSGRAENHLPQVTPVRRLNHSRNSLFTYRVLQSGALETITPSSYFE